MNTEKFKVGDRVLVRGSLGWAGSQHKPGTVTKRTPSGILTVAVEAFPPHGTIVHEKKFKASGWEWGSSNYHGDSVVEFSQDVLDRERDEAQVRKARRFVEDEQMWRKLDDKLVLRIAAIVKTEIAEEKGE